MNFFIAILNILIFILVIILAFIPFAFITSILRKRIIKKCFNKIVNRIQIQYDKYISENESEIILKKIAGNNIQMSFYIKGRELGKYLFNSIDTMFDHAEYSNKLREIITERGIIVDEIDIWFSEISSYKSYEDETAMVVIVNI